MRRVITLLAVVALVGALPMVVSISAALAQPGGAATPAEYAGVLLALLVSALGCAACLLSLRAAPGGRLSAGVVALAGVAPLAILGAIFSIGLSGFAPLIALLNALDPTALWGVICALAVAAPLVALASMYRWRLAPAARTL
jgi:hypothetical protein